MQKRGTSAWEQWLVCYGTDGVATFQTEPQAREFASAHCPSVVGRETAERLTVVCNYINGEPVVLFSGN